MGCGRGRPWKAAGLRLGTTPRRNASGRRAARPCDGEAMGSLVPARGHPAEAPLLLPAGAR
eukprot:11195537-Lingulodinium_polyedra.AAC.1